MIFELVKYRGRLLGEKGDRTLEIMLETRASKGFICAENEVEAAQKVGLVQLRIDDGEHSLQAAAARYYVPRGTEMRSVMAAFDTGRDRSHGNGAMVFVVAKIPELARDQFARQ